MDTEEVEDDKPEMKKVKLYEPDIITDETQVLLYNKTNRKCQREKTVGNGNKHESQARIIRKLQGIIKDDDAVNSYLNQSIKRSGTSNCIICDNSFMGHLKLKIHYIHHHHLVACEICDLLFEDEEVLKIHVDKVHFSKSCELCQEIITDDMSKDHYDSHDVIECPYCSLLLQPKCYIETHLKIKHQALKSFKYGMEIYTKLDTRFNGFHCNMCGTTRKKEMFAHFAYYHKMSVYFLERLFTKANIDLVLETINDGVEKLRKSFQLTCDICQNEYSIEIPKTFHDVYCSSNYLCKFCSKTYTTIEDLDNHAYEIHNNFKCLRCGVSFKIWDNLKLHYKKQHSLVFCTYCEELVDDDLFKDHLTTNHMSLLNLTHENLIGITSREECKVQCILCLQDISSSINVISEMFRHFSVKHKVSLRPLLRCIGSNPFQIKVETAKKEIAENISNPIEEVETAKDEKAPTSSSSEEENDPINYEVEYEKQVDPTAIRILTDIQAVYKDNNRLTCPFCKTFFETKIRFFCHLYEIHRCILNEKYFNCDKCVCNKMNLEKHLYSHFFKDENGDSLSLDPLATQLDDSTTLYKCSFCSEMLTGVQFYMDHERVHYNDVLSKFFQCSTCFETFGSEDTFYKHIKLSGKCTSFSNLTYVCDLCKLAVTTFEILREHFLESHEDRVMFLCPNTTCTRLFGKKRYVQKHIKKHHVKTKKKKLIYKCDLCDKAFKTEKNILWHQKSSHGSNMFACKICEEKFNTPRERKFHYRNQHSGEIIFTCKICEKGFTSRSGLHNHLRSHENFLATCSYCGKDFTNSASYKEHLRIHIGPKHQCPYCTKSFTQKSNLRRHIRLHTGETPYSCKICWKKFSDKSQLNSHQESHLIEERNFHCECGKSYKHKRHLMIHVIKVHGKQPADIEKIFVKVEDDNDGSYFDHNLAEQENEGP